MPLHLTLCVALAYVLCGVEQITSTLCVGTVSGCQKWHNVNLDLPVVACGRFVCSCGINKAKWSGLNLIVAWIKKNDIVSSLACVYKTTRLSRCATTHQHMQHATPPVASLTFFDFVGRYIPFVWHTIPPTPTNGHATCHAASCKLDIFDICRLCRSLYTLCVAYHTAPHQQMDMQHATPPVASLTFFDLVGTYITFVWYTMH